VDPAATLRVARKYIKKETKNRDQQDSNLDCQVQKIVLTPLCYYTIMLTNLV
jgi:hypothetical protein